MNAHIIGLIIKREYLNKVKKKSFLITTFVVPILMAALCIVPIALMLTSKEKAKNIAYVDRSGIVESFLTDSDIINFKNYNDFPDVDSLKKNMESLGLEAVLVISPVTEDKSVNPELTSINPLGLEMVESINRRINDAVEEYRIQSYNIEGLGQIMEDVKANVRLKSFTMDDTGKETVSESGVYTILSMVLGLILFLFITMFGSMVMSAVIEEKSSRVVEVLVSSVKATELMFGKIIGIALVALTQFILWIVLTFGLVTIASSAMGQNLFSGSDPAEMMSSMGVSVESDVNISDILSENDDFSVIMTTIKSLPIAKIIIVFFIFFVLGYMLYASLFAAIGSAVENEGDTQQLQLPVTIPLMIGYFIAIYTFNAPDSPIAFWGSIFPFTSPIVMLARLPYGVPGWELILSILLLALTFFVFAWLSAKIYKVGILMFGKKSSWKDLWKWIRMK